MDAFILHGVGKKVRLAFANGKKTKEEVISIYNRNKKEAEEFSVFGYKENEIYSLIKETHNPLLKSKLEQYLKTREDNRNRSHQQNALNIEKLELLKKDACGVGLRRVIKRLKREYKKTKNIETKIVCLLLETEFANLSAKRYNGAKKRTIYDRKVYLLLQLSYYLDIAGWKYGINDDTGKNASYLVYVYLPNDVQLC